MERTISFNPPSSPPSSPPSLLSAIKSQMGFSCFPDEDDFGEEMNHEEEQDIGSTGQQAAATTEVLGTPDCAGKRKDIPESSAANEKPAKELKVILPRSPVWDHFTRNKEDRNKCICQYCKKEYCYKSKSGTSNLTKHMATYKQYQAYKENKSQQVIKDNGTVQAGKISEPMFREATNEMLVLGELPLSFVDSVAWIYFSSRANLYRLHSRRTASRDIVQMYVKKKALLKNWINSNKQRVSLTTDIWVAPNTVQATW
ncbi:PREDICTED: uncharacterized protein LOC104741132 isoform X2 [Camelina sativa]|uniref:Uncharacterized protein LOC104741132 isoform X2 n=1 Tax=Camelina sativa TaxID=90675 RepID=A0ABM0VRV6_CAMSA|nr:PREDICTED: uncharacterized protein LOC104741132 isoform X2 [Camelina sativa]